MQIMIGCERLQAEKCFQILYFPFSHLTCLHTHNCSCCNKTCFWGWLLRLLKHNWDSMLMEAAFQKWNLQFFAAGLFVEVHKLMALL